MLADHIERIGNVLSCSTGIHRLLHEQQRPFTCTCMQGKGDNLLGGGNDQWLSGAPAGEESAWAPSTAGQPATSENPWGTALPQVSTIS
jgi:hypothetical protein